MEKNIFNYDYINDVRYRYIKNRMGENVTLLLSSIKKLFPKSKIYLVGSVIDFTFLKDFSDVDCLIEFSNENDKLEIIKYISQQNNITHINNFIFEKSYYNKKNTVNVFRCKFDNNELIDVSFFDHDALSFQKKELLKKGIHTKMFHYIFKICNKYKLINNKTFYYLKKHPIVTYKKDDEFGEYKSKFIGDIKIK